MKGAFEIKNEFPVKNCGNYIPWEENNGLEFEICQNSDGQCQPIEIGWMKSLMWSKPEGQLPIPKCPMGAAILELWNGQKQRKEQKFFTSALAFEDGKESGKYLQTF